MPRRLTVGAILLGLACASPQRESPAPDLSVVRAQVDSVWTKYSAAAVAGDRVLQFGAYRDVLQSTGKPAEVVVGRYAAVLPRDSTSAWRVSRLIAVADSTVPQLAKPK